MVRWICRVRPSDEPNIEGLHKKLSHEDLTILIRRHRLRWFGHVECTSGEISRMRSMHIVGKKGTLWGVGHGNPRKIWSECAREDLDAFKLKPSDMMPRTELVRDPMWRTVNWSLPHPPLALLEECTPTPVSNKNEIWLNSIEKGLFLPVYVYIMVYTII